MDFKKPFNEFLLILLVTIVLGVSFTYPSKGLSGFLSFFVIFFSIIVINTLAKQFFAYNLETNVNLKLWTIYRFGLLKRMHFKNPLPMIWLPIITSLFSRGVFVWLPLLEFDVSPRPERITKRHGLYRYTEVTEWHMALIAVFGLIVNIILGILGYFAGFESFARYSVMYALWSLLPISSLDGSKIFFGSRNLWFTMLVIVLAVFLWSLSII